jgi:hypothetical protein
MATYPILGQAIPAGSGDPPEDFVHGWNAQGHFQMVFRDSAHAASWHNTVTMNPEVNPQSDATIAQVQAQRVHWIATMVHAVYNRTICTDGNKVLKMFDPDTTEYAQLLKIEAGCHALFYHVIARCRQGYRGMTKFNLLTGRGRTGDKDRADATANYLTCITNLVQALRGSKSICQEMILEESKAKRLANTPLMLCAKKGIEKRINYNKARMNIKRKQEDAAAEAIQKQDMAAFDRPSLQDNSQMGASGGTGVLAPM